MAFRDQLLGKRPRTQFHGLNPGDTIRPGSGPPPGFRGVPQGSSIPVSISNSHSHTPSNNTASLPLLVRPWVQEFEKAYHQGSPLFVMVQNVGRSSLSTVADIPTLNWLLVERVRMTGLGQTPSPDSGLYPESKPAGWGLDGSKIVAENPKSLLASWNFFGVLRNRMDANSRLQQLFNCDCWGRSKVANIFSSKRRGIKRGDHVGLAVVRFDLEKFQAVHHPSGGEGMPVEMLPEVARQDGTDSKLLPLTLGGRVQADAQNVGGNLLPNARWAYQIVGTLNGVPAVGPECLLDFQHVKSNKLQNEKDDVVKKGCVIHHIPLGIVSHAVSRAPSEAARLFALKSSEDMTSLPQIEILM